MVMWLRSQFDNVHHHEVWTWGCENPRRLCGTSVLLSKSNHFVCFVSRPCPLFLCSKDCTKDCRPWHVETPRLSTKSKTAFNLSRLDGVRLYFVNVVHEFLYTKRSEVWIEGRCESKLVRRQPRPPGLSSLKLLMAQV